MHVTREKLFAKARAMLKQHPHMSWPQALHKASVELHKMAGDSKPKKRRAPRKKSHKK